MNSLLSRDEQAQETTLSHLTGTLIGQISKLARQEVALAKAEVKQVAHKSARDGVGIVAGAVLVHAAVMTLVALACVGLSFVMPLWASMACVSAVLLLAGSVTIKLSLDKLKDDSTLEHLPKSLAANREFLREQVA